MIMVLLSPGLANDLSRAEFQPVMPRLSYQGTRGLVCSCQTVRDGRAIGARTIGFFGSDGVQTPHARFHVYDPALESAILFRGLTSD
jgi:hypothetical protein